MVLEKENIYKLRGILEDGEINLPFNKNKLEENEENVEGLFSSFLKKENLIRNGVDKFDGKFSCFIYGDYIENNGAEFYNFEDEASLGLNDDLNIEKYKKSVLVGEEGSLKVIIDLREYLENDFASEVIKMIEVETQEAKKRLEKQDK